MDYMLFGGVVVAIVIIGVLALMKKSKARSIDQ